MEKYRGSHNKELCISAVRGLIILLILVNMMVLGCGKANDQAPSVDVSGNHPVNWLIAHRASFQQNSSQCRECHGTDLKGGITKVDCFNQSGLGQCHAGGHAPRIASHQIPFTDGTVHGPIAKKDLSFCQSCHGTAGGPGSNPRFNVPIGSLVHGCEDCHLPNTAHPTERGTSGWNGHSSAGNMGNNCILCHGIDLTGGVGPGCNTCHTALSPGTVPAVGTCVSCHSDPPVTGSHTIHNALPEVVTDCSSCHSSAGNGTPLHRDSTVNVVVATAYNAKTGSAFRNNGSCLDISCHGGVTTSAWGGSLTNACLSCHTAGSASGVPQYNSYYSGRHALHINGVGLQCTDCHAMAVTVGGAGHFTGLKTAVFELAPSATIRVPGYPSCNPGSNPLVGTYSIGVCHSSKVW